MALAALAALRRNVGYWGMSGFIRNGRPLRILTHIGSRESFVRPAWLTYNSPPKLYPPVLPMYVIELRYLYPMDGGAVLAPEMPKSLPSMLLSA
jgi:hypothetical protein